MYKFISELYTYNPIKGACSHKCNYCFMIAMRHRFKQDPTLRLDQKELTRSLGKNRFVFVGSSTDDFAADVPRDWIDQVLNHLYDYPDNEYMLQSKNPVRFLEFVNHKFFKDRKDKLILCTTIESDIDYPDVSAAPLVTERVAAMKHLHELGFKTMVTIEPIMKFSDVGAFAAMLESFHPIQVNFGANTSKKVKLIEPTRFHILSLITQLRGRGIRVHCKSDLDRLVKKSNKSDKIKHKAKSSTLCSGEMTNPKIV